MKMLQRISVRTSRRQPPRSSSSSTSSCSIVAQEKRRCAPALDSFKTASARFRPQLDGGVGGGGGGGGDTEKLLAPSLFLPGARHPSAPITARRRPGGPSPLIGAGCQFEFPRGGG